MLMQEYSERFQRIFALASEQLGPVRALILWGSTYTTLNDRFSEERLHQFNRIVLNLRQNWI